MMSLLSLFLILCTDVDSGNMNVWFLCKSVVLLYPVSFTAWFEIGLPLLSIILMHDSA